MDFTSFEFLIDLLGDAAKAEFSQNMLMFTIAWTIVRKTIQKHFENIELRLTEVANSVTKLNDSMVKLETNHELRIASLEKHFHNHLKTNLKGE